MKTNWYRVSFALLVIIGLNIWYACISVKNNNSTRISFVIDKNIIENKTKITTNNNVVEGFFVFSQIEDTEGLTPKLYYTGMGDLTLEIIDNRGINVINFDSFSPGVQYKFRIKFKKEINSQISLLLIWEGKRKCGQDFITHIKYHP